MVREQQLSDVLNEFARTMLTDFPIQAILDRLVVRIVDVLPITSAGVTLVTSDSDLRFVAASDESALRFERLQTELGEGPCVMAYDTGEAVAVADLRREERFPTFGPRALEAGLGAVFTFPLRRDGGSLGALDLYRETPGALDAHQLDVAQTLADVASAYLQNAQARVELGAAYDQARESSLHDPLTGLPNRALLAQRLDQAAARARRSGTTAGVLFADLDRFKEVNDTHGHRAGDELLVAVAGRMASLLRPSDTLARLSGDEFVILCEDLDSPSRVEALAARLDTALSAPFVLADATVTITASVGIAFAGRADDIPARLVHDADRAMYQAKRTTGAQHSVIDVREERVADRRTSLASDLREAAARGELRLAYQPVVSATDGRMCGLEAFLRWHHPRFGDVSPQVVLRLAEEAGRSAEVGEWVLREACGERHRWGDELKLSVNVSARQLLSRDFAATVEAVLHGTGTPPGALSLDVPATLFEHDRERARIVVQDLRALGVGIALDDFGTGGASLVGLKGMPFDAVKVDPVFVAGLPHDRPSTAIVSAVVQLARGLGIEAVAEGVESAEQLAAVVALGCDLVQGFYLARPMSTADAATLLAGASAGNGLRLPVMPAGRP
jgi:diguanylate cyclase (GGDEF)-like protein